MPTLATLPVVECWTRLAGEYTAMLSFCHDGDVHAMPVNIVVRDRQVWFRAPEGAKLRAARGGTRMALAVHRQDAIDHAGWSVTARGRASVEEDGPPFDGGPPVRPWAMEARNGAWVHVAVDTITGRQLVLGPAGMRS